MDHVSTDETTPQREFDYVLPRGTTRFWVLFCIVGAILFGYECVTNDRGLIINGMIPFTPFGATVFYGLCAAGFVFTLGFRLQLLYRRRTIAIADASLRFPKAWWSSETRTVRFEDIRSARLASTASAVDGGRLLTMRDKSGTAIFAEGLFSSPAEFDEFLHLLTRSVTKHGDPDALWNLTVRPDEASPPQ